MSFMKTYSFVENKFKITNFALNFTSDMIGEIKYNSSVPDAEASQIKSLVKSNLFNSLLSDLKKF